MEKITLLEEIMRLLNRSAMPYNELYLNNFEKKGIRRSEFSSCIEDLKKQEIIYYKGTNDDDVDIVLTNFGEEIIKEYGSYKEYLKALSSETLYDKIIHWAKNNVIIVAILFLVLIVGGAVGFKENIKKLFCPGEQKITKDTIKPVTVTVPKTISFRSDFINFNTRVEEKIKADSIKPSNNGSDLAITLVVDSCTPEPVDGSATKGWHYYCEGGKIRINFFNKNVVETGLKVPATTHQSSPEKATAEYKENCENILDQNFDRLYDTIKKYARK